MALLRYESQVRPPLVEGNKDYHQVTEDICRPVEAKPTKTLVDRFYYFRSGALLWYSFRNHGSNLWYRPVEPE